MSARGLLHRFFIVALAGTFSLLAMWTVPAQAQSQTPATEPKCVNCHENLYFLHDTGKWFCLSLETSMTCVDCHGGDPAATTQETAHAERAAHPVINADVSKCQECHPEKCAERVEIFRQVAGISPVMVSRPYQPAVIVAEVTSIPVTGAEEATNWIMAIDSLVFIFVVGLAVTIFVIYNLRHKTSHPS